MIRFLLKGIIRDRSRSLFPLLVVAAGVFLTVALYGYVVGEETIIILANANFQSGFVKVTTRAYAQEAEQLPNDLALTGIPSLIAGLESEFPKFIWLPRIRFGGLLDIPDEKGETRSQGPVSGIAAQLRSTSGQELKILDLRKALVRGRLPEQPKEVLISDDFARKLGVEPGGRATLIGSTMFGSMSMTNFIVTGTVRFGISAMDKTAMIADLSDIQNALDMKDAAGEILGLSRDSIYRQKDADATVSAFSGRHRGESGDFAPVMVTLRNQPGMATILDLISYAMGLVIGLFLFAMSIVLWNAGLMGSLRRYGEIGVRLAIGEDKGHLYRSLIYESLIVGFLGTLVGTALGLALSYYLQEKGINIASLVKNAGLMVPTVLHSQITPLSYFIGFVPGFLAILLGTAISGLGIYKRQTAQLFKELET